MGREGPAWAAGRTSVKGLVFACAALVWFLAALASPCFSWGLVACGALVWRLLLRCWPFLDLLVVY